MPLQFGDNYFISIEMDGTYQIKEKTDSPNVNKFKTVKTFYDQQEAEEYLKFLYDGK